ncbi:MAG: copper oxidase [Geobacter sp.]|nr:MAG: copper oxidase [Geobacter sp.]
MSKHNAKKKGGTDMFRRLLFLSLTVAVVAAGLNMAQAGPGTMVNTVGPMAPPGTLTGTGTPWPPSTPGATQVYSGPQGGTFYANSPAGTWKYKTSSEFINYTTAGFVAYSSASSNSGTPLQKFIHRLPGLGAPGCTASNGTGTCNENELNQYIPIADADVTTYPGSDYYEIAVKDYTEKLHPDLPKATLMRAYVQLNSGNDPTWGGTISPAAEHYLGPLILAQMNRPVRIKFVNQLGVNGAGDLFIPVDKTYMGAGMGPKHADGTPCDPAMDTTCAMYTENRAVVHLHGGATPWISDGTPRQWIAPAGENTPFKRGVSQVNVPDMPDPQGLVDGVATYYYTNQQSNRLMFYHDHVYGTTRLDVYVGEAAGYLLTDPVETDLIDGTNLSTFNTANLKVIPNNGGGVYKWGVPLVLQDKTFVPQDIAIQDAYWTNPKWGTYGDLWFPHVYETNQDPNAPDQSGANNFGRWDYGPWFWPPVLIDAAHQTAAGPVHQWQLSSTPEAFMDTPVINGAAYPYMDVNPEPYRFRILNASNDRPYNLQMYVADPLGYSSAATNNTSTEVKMVDAIPRPVCTATLTTSCTCDGVNSPPGCFPTTWPTDGRDGGVPDPALAGPKFVQIGTEGGFLPKSVVLDNQPVNYVYNRRNIVVLDVQDKTLLLAAAERADVIVDFSKYAGQTVILYNDCPTPMPAFDTRYDYYTWDPDQTYQGGAPTTQPGYGPNTRTIMQFRVAATPTANTNLTTALYDDPVKLAALDAGLKEAFDATQPKPIVPEKAYGSTADHYAKIQDYTMTFTPVGETAAKTITFKSKAIQELWDPWGRMNATLGVELPFTNNNIQTTIPLGYLDPTTEFIHNNETQIWKITHNGVDTHPVHVHLYNAQLINRVGWDGAIRPPDPNELGWKETIKMKPLEDVIIALRPTLPTLPFALPNSVRPVDPTMPIGATLTLINPVDGNAISVVNKLTNYGQEYVWHCHILGHEENDFMRVQTLRTPINLDFENDGMRDLAVWRPSTGNWYVLLSSTNSVKPAVKLGRLGDIPVSGDYDGDSKSDLAVWRPTSGIWYVLDSSTNTLEPNVVLGANGDIPVFADYDGDAKTDKAVFTPSTGIWKIISSSNGTTRTQKLGRSGDIPVPSDYTGDGNVDIAVWRPTSGNWYILNSSTNLLEPTITFGTSTDTPVPGDYDGDGQSDRAVYHTNGTWGVIFSSNNLTNSVTTIAALIAPAAGDIPVPGDYCGDHKTRPSIWRPSTHTLYTQNCSTGALRSVLFSTAVSTDTIIK